VTRLGPTPAALILALCAAVVGANERVRTDNGRLWIECRDASLSEVLREIAAVVPMEVWLDEGAGDERVSLSLAGVTMKTAVEKLFESSKLNYALTLDPADADKIARIYVGRGGGEGPAAPAEPEEDPDPEQFLESPEAQDALRDLKSFLEQQKTAVETSENAGSSVGLPSELEELLDSIPVPPTSPPPPEPPKAKEKEKPPQL
jgi:hypothetical protein